MSSFIQDLMKYATRRVPWYQRASTQILFWLLALLAGAFGLGAWLF